MTLRPARRSGVVFAAVVIYAAGWFVLASVIPALVDTHHLGVDPGAMATFLASALLSWGPVVLGLVVGFATARWWALGLVVIPAALIFLSAPGFVTCFGSYTQIRARYGCEPPLDWDAYWAIAPGYLIGPLICLGAGVAVAWGVAARKTRRLSAGPEA